MKLRIELAYDGSHYHGWQVQPNGVSVQEKINDACRALFGFDCDVTGCSRTDSGVHARQYFATVEKKGTDSLETAIPVARLPLAFNAHLPTDIRVVSATFVPSDFHARYAVKKKEYVYRIWNATIDSPFEIGRAYTPTHPLDDAQIERMNIAAQALIGKHDFTSLMTPGSKVSDTVRTVYTAYFEKEGQVLTFHVSADGFLYNMVRIMVGTLLDIGVHGKDAQAVTSILDARDRTKAGPTVPPEGLYLNQVFY